MKKTKKTKNVDSFCRKGRISKSFDYPLARFARRYSRPSVLYSPKFGRTDNFSTDNLYLHHIKSDKQPDFTSFDGFLRFEKKIPLFFAIRNRLDIRQSVIEQYGGAKEYFCDLFRGRLGEMSPVKLWNMSIVGALFVGMFLMTSIYRYLGQDAGAAEVQVSSTSGQSQVLGDQTEGASSANAGNSAAEQAALKEYVAKIMADYQKNPNQDQQEFLTAEMTNLVKGYPIEQMVPYIAQQDKVVAAFMIAIAKQESDWGVHVPAGPDGQECYNDWGFRGKNPVGTGGHSCFSSPEDAVDTVAKRLQILVSNEKVDTPDKMVVVWKCGYDCSWSTPEAVDQWIYAVNLYFQKLNVKESNS